MRTKTALVVLLGLLLLGAGGVTWAAPGPLKAKKCLKCHGEWKKADNVVMGDFQSRSNKAKSISVKTKAGVTQVIKFTPQTKVKNVAGIKKLRKPIPVRVMFEKRGPDLVALEIVAKPMIKVPAKQLVDVKTLTGMWRDKLAGKADFLLVDSRPGIRFKEAHIPGAISIPFPKMPDMLNKLPKDKGKLIVFYCGGFR